MSTGEISVLVVTGAVAGAAVVAVLVPYLRRVRRDSAHFAGVQQPEGPGQGTEAGRNHRQSPRIRGGGGERPFGPSSPPRSRAAAARRKTAEVFARAESSIPDSDRAAVWHEVAAESGPFRVSYRWATRFGTLFVFGVLFFVASVVALLGDYSRVLLAATLLFSAVLVGLPALKLHRIVWQALNLSTGVYLALLEGEGHADE